MFNQISWTTYFYILLFFTIGYYLIVFILYYFPFIKRKLDEQLVNNSAEKSNADNTKAYSLFTTANKSTSEESSFALTQTLITEIGIVIEKASLEQFGKDELITSLQLVISAYPNLKGTPFMTPLNSYIAEESQINCSITLSEEDLKIVWNGR